MKEAPVASNPPIAFAQECHRGIVREENQDSILHTRVAMGELLIVADGIGGYQGGATASRMVVEGFQNYLEALLPESPVDRALLDATAQVNASIIQAANLPDSPYRRMGSTVVLALLQLDATGLHARIGHVGDSRAYLFRGNQLTRITSDHSAVQALLNRNLITPEQALNHPDASVLTRSLGHKPDVEMDLENVDLLPGDTLLLCSDGLWGYVAEEAIQHVLADPGLNVDGAGRALLDLALAAGGQDNIGIELARIGLPAGGAPASFKGPRRRGFMEFFALGLLAVGVLGAAAYFAGRSPAVRNMLHSAATARTASPDAATQGAGAGLTYAMILGQGADESKLYPVQGWNPSDVLPEKVFTCRKLAADASKITVYYKDLAQEVHFVATNQSFFKDLTVANTKRIDQAIEAGCGDFDLVVFVPGTKQATAANTEVHPQPAVKLPGDQPPPPQPPPAVKPEPQPQVKPVTPPKQDEPKKTDDKPKTDGQQKPPDHKPAMQDDGTATVPEGATAKPHK
jgi:protein phosphatase